METEQKDELFKYCIHLVTTSTSLSYCIKLHEWITKCPVKCGFFEEGSSGKIDNLRKEKFNPECYYFVRNRSGKFLYQCNLFKQENPLCESCQYLKLVEGNS